MKTAVKNRSALSGYLIARDIHPVYAPCHKHRDKYLVPPCAQEPYPGRSKFLQYFLPFLRGEPAKLVEGFPLDLHPDHLKPLF